MQHIKHKINEVSYILKFGGYVGARSKQETMLKRGPKSIKQPEVKQSKFRWFYYDLLIWILA